MVNRALKTLKKSLPDTRQLQPCWCLTSESCRAEIYIFSYFWYWKWTWKWLWCWQWCIWWCWWRSPACYSTPSWTWCTPAGPSAGGAGAPPRQGWRQNCCFFYIFLHEDHDDEDVDPKSVGHCLRGAKHRQLWSEQWLSQSAQYGVIGCQSSLMMINMINVFNLDLKTIARSWVIG